MCKGNCDRKLVEPPWSYELPKQLVSWLNVVTDASVEYHSGIKFNG